MKNQVASSQSKFTLSLSPMWRKESKRLNADQNTAKCFAQSPTKKKLSHTTELDVYKERLFRGHKQSPIIKAYNNIDEFYRSIRPVKGKIAKTLLNDSIAKEKYDPMFSFYSKKSDEDVEPSTLSEIVAIQQIEMLNELISEETIQHESDAYQTALKCLCDKIFPIFHKRKMNSLRNSGLGKTPNKSFDNFASSLSELLNEKKNEMLNEKNSENT